MKQSLIKRIAVCFLVIFFLTACSTVPIAKQETLNPGQMALLGNETQIEPTPPSKSETSTEQPEPLSDIQVNNDDVAKAARDKKIRDQLAAEKAAAEKAEKTVVSKTVPKNLKGKRITVAKKGVGTKKAQPSLKKKAPLQKNPAQPVTLDALAKEVAKHEAWLNRHERMLTAVDLEFHRIGVGSAADVDVFEFYGFEIGSHTVTMEMKEAMARVAADLKKNIDKAAEDDKEVLAYSFTVQSYSSKTGSPEKNADLRRQRSEEIRKFFDAALKKVGIESDIKIVDGETSERSKIGTNIDCYSRIEKEEMRVPITKPNATSQAE